jgi:hypothetical protein
VGIHIDEEWEYYTPDPEIEEITDIPKCKVIYRMPYKGFSITRLVKGCGKGNWGHGTLRQSHVTEYKKRMLERLWYTKMTVWEICTTLHTDITTLTKWRKELRLPSRMKAGVSCNS